MAKETLSFKAEEKVKDAIEKAAKRKEWTRSYYLESIVKEHLKRNKLIQ